MSKESSLNRVLTIINDLNQGKKLNISNLSLRFNVSTRTIRRDIKSIEESFSEDFLQKDGENIFIIQKDFFSNILSGFQVASFVHILNVFNTGGIKLELPEEFNKLIKNIEHIYDIKNKPFEHLENNNIIKDLEKSIKYKQIIDITYPIKDKEQIITFKPYKIKMLNENFYLLGENTKGVFSNFRINLIKSVNIKSQTFYKDKEIIDFIDNMQTPFSNFEREPIQIEVSVNKYVSKYFKMKTFFPSQIIKEETKEGGLIINFTITDYREIEDFVIQWMPAMKIISPKKFKERIEMKLEKKLQSLNHYSG